MTMRAITHSITDTFPAGDYAVTMTVTPLRKSMRIDAEWSPRFPKKLTKREWEQYYTGRNALIDTLSKELDVNVLVLG